MNQKSNDNVENYSSDKSSFENAVIPSQKLFVENVKKWAICDQQLKHIKDKTDQIRELKNTLGSSICTYMIDNNLSNNAIEITNGKLKVCEKKEYSPLTYSYIEQCLAKIISEQSHVDYIIRYLKNNREIKTTVELKMCKK
jgi:hypothetical protein